MRTDKHKHLLAMAECAVMAALAVVLDLLPLPRWPNGGSLSLVAVPIVYISYRRGAVWGMAAGFIDALVQMTVGWYPPPAGTAAAVIGGVLLDYVLAFTVLGAADPVARLFRKRKRIGYIVGAFAVNLARLACSTASGAILWGSTLPEGVPVWTASFLYNAGYMIPNALVCAAVIGLLCSLVSPETLRPMKKRA